MNRLTLTLAAALLVSTVAKAVGPDQPNILWLSAEDISPTLGCYGDPHAITPHLDDLAGRGVRYTHAFTAAGVCAPCRSTIISGLYQTTLGTHHMRCNATLAPEVVPFPLLLREVGYYCTNNSKTDYQFKKPGARDIWDVSGSKGHWRNRDEPDQPFFAVFNYTGCHESGIAGEDKYRSVTKALTDEQRQDREALTTLPPYYPDTPVVREDWGRMYETITAMDAWAGDLLAQLEEDGLAENTIVFFWSDHGVGLPRAKRWLYDSGTRVPFILHFPEKWSHLLPFETEQGKATERLISSVDFGPTVLSLAGIAPTETMQGYPFAGEHEGLPRDYVFGARDRMDERYDIIRAVRDGRFRYIRNYTALRPYYQYMNTPEKGATMREIRIGQEAGTLPPAAALFAADRKPIEEFYDLEADPHEINNLADDPDFAEELERLRAAHRDWVERTGDLGLYPESQLEAAVAAGEVEATWDLSRNSTPETNAAIAQTADLASRGVEGFDQLVEATQHSSATVRYWAATGIGNMADQLDSDNVLRRVPQSGTAKVHATRLTEDDDTAVRIAAARALLRLRPYLGDKHRDEALPLLVAELDGPLQWARLEASIVLDEADEAARPVLEAMEESLAQKQPNKYILRVLNRAVNDLNGTDNRVP